MTGLLDVMRTQNDIGSPDQIVDILNKKPIFGAFGCRMAKGPFSVFGMALGYLGLVVMLSTAPYWNQVITPAESYVAACSDFGGSR